MHRGAASVLAVVGIGLAIAGCSAPAPTDADLARWQAWSDRATAPLPGDLATIGAVPSLVASADVGITSTFARTTPVDAVVMYCTGAERMRFEIHTVGREVRGIGSIDVPCDSEATTIALDGIPADGVRVEAVQPDGLGQWAAHVRQG